MRIVFAPPPFGWKDAPGTKATLRSIATLGGQHVRLVVLRLSVPRASTRSFDDRLRVQRAVLVGQSYANLRVVAVVDHRSDRAELQALECPVPIEVLDVSGLTPEDVARVLLARVHGGPDANSEVVLPEPETFRESG